MKQIKINFADLTKMVIVYTYLDKEKLIDEIKKSITQAFEKYLTNIFNEINKLNELISNSGNVHDNIKRFKQAIDIFLMLFESNNEDRLLDILSNLVEQKKIFTYCFIDLDDTEYVWLNNVICYDEFVLYLIHDILNNDSDLIYQIKLYNEYLDNIDPVILNYEIYDFGLDDLLSLLGIMSDNNFNMLFEDIKDIWLWENDGEAKFKIIIRKILNIYISLIKNILPYIMTNDQTRKNKVSLNKNLQTDITVDNKFQYKSIYDYCYESSIIQKIDLRH